MRGGKMTDGILDREKVMRGLEHCALSHKSLTLCDGCDYYAHMDPPCIAVLAEDTLALLKAQEPRVMTLEETIASCDEPVWLEENTLQGSYGAWGIVKGLHEQYKAAVIDEVRFTYWAKAKYNITWRCWSARPTEEQRKAVPWDGKN